MSDPSQENDSLDSLEEPPVDSDSNTASSLEPTSIQPGEVDLSTAPLESTGDPPPPGHVIYALTILVEGGLLLFALLFGWAFSFHDSRQAIGDMASWSWSSGLFWGTLSALPLLAAGLSIGKFEWGRKFSQEVDQLIRRFLKNVSVAGILFISICAGIGEEMFFRWCLQGGLQELFSFEGGTILAILIASVVFGVMHCVNLTYVILATVAGLYFGVLLWITGSVLIPIVGHAVYDFLILYWLLYLKRN